MRIAPLLVCLLLALGCGSGFSNETWVAEVDGTQITLDELKRAMADRREMLGEQARDEDLLNDSLDQLVSETAILNHAKRLGIDVLDSEIESRLLRLHSEVVKLDDEYREEVRRQMLLERTELYDLAAKATVPGAEIDLFYEEHRERFQEPQRVQIRQILVEEEGTAQNLLKELKGGADFAALAAEHSLAPEGSDGGLLPPFAEGELPETFDEAFKLKEGQAKLLTSPYGFHVVKVETRFKPRQQEFHEVREQIVLELERERMEKQRREWIRGLRRQADLRVNDEVLETLR